MSVADARTDQAELQTGRGDVRLDQRLGNLPAGHPSSPRYPDAGVADRVRPLTDAEHAEHVADVRHRLAEARKAGLATEFRHTIDPAREIWSRGRRAIHDQILNDLRGLALAVPCERKAIVAGGLPGAGKTTVLANYAGIDRSRYLTINPDDVKENMASRGLIPLVDGLSPLESAGLVHEESSHIAKRLARTAQAAGMNIIWDVTLSRADSAAKRIASLREVGYTQVNGVFVDIPPDVSARRADMRYREGHDDYRAGVGHGGRYVPAEMIYAQHDGIWGSQNRANFEQLKRRFDSWWIYDNSADYQAPILSAIGVRPAGEREEARG